MSRRIPGVCFYFGVIASVLLVLSGCSKTSGEAEVLEKEHIAAREPSPTPTSPAPDGPAVSPPASPADDSYTERTLAEDEIVVDTIVMKKDVRGTSRDPRAHTDEQWIVRIRMIADSRGLTAFTEKKRWETLKPGDRVKVTYSKGNYTGSIWSVRIE